MEKHITVRRLNREDVEVMASWGKHSDLLFQHYNFPELTLSERGVWYRMKSSGKKRRCFAVLDEDNRVAGYLSMKRIKVFRKTSELGIVLDPDRVGQGYGTLALKAFLKMYFEEFRMNKLFLQVALFNERAIRAYRKSGFVVEKEMVLAFEEQEIDRDLLREAMMNDHQLFIENNRIYCRYYLMSIDKEAWFSPQQDANC